ncbi:hypothetical protein SAMN02910301_0379 [Lachnospiraceae bacterium XBD2001]|nr:hypothetical protein SAMN02910301_0379 [Lachnospiraceae bacterium XBD2001]
MQKLLSRMAILAIFVMVLINTFAAAYTVPVSDDFGTYQSLAGMTSPLGQVGNALTLSIGTYKTWQGTYFSSFINPLLSPLNVGGMWLLRVEMVIHSLLFFVALIFFLHSFCNLVLAEGKKEPWLYVVALFVFAMTCFGDYREVWFWFNGSCVHSLPLILMLFSLGFTLRAIHSNRISNVILACIFAFGGLGGALVVVAGVCYLLLVLDVYLLLTYKKIPIRQLIISVVYLCFALVNASAPGNFVRHNVIDNTGVHPLNALRGTYQILVTRIETMQHGYAIWVLIICFFVVGLYAKVSDKVNPKAYLVSSFLLFGTPIIAVFPLALGYSSLDLTSRASFSVDLFIYVAVFNIAFVTGVYVDSIRGQVTRKLITTFAVVLAVFSLSTTDYSLGQIRIIRTGYGLATGKYQDYYSDCHELFHRLEKRRGDVVLQPEEMPIAPRYMHEFYITSDAESWENRAIANYFGLDSIRLGTENE